MAQVVYCTSADLLLPGEALQELQSTDIDRAIKSASSEADSYLSTRWTLPLVMGPDGWPTALVNAVAQIATYRAMLLRGYAPVAGQNDSIRDGYKDALAFLKALSKGEATLQVRGSNADAETQQGGGPGTSPFVIQPDGPGGGTFKPEEDFWHDRDSAAGGAGAFTGPRRRGY